MFRDADLTDDYILISLRRQHTVFERSGYDGHNRRSGLVTMRRIRSRRLRRHWKRRLASWTGAAWAAA